MGTRNVATKSPRATSLADALFSTTQQRVLGLLFGQPQRSFYANEIISLTAAGSGAVQRELARLEQSGLVTTRRIGSQKHFQANSGSPLFTELCAIARKTFGVVEPLRRALAPAMSKIKAAFIYGSVAKRQDAASSDIDLMVVSDRLNYADLFVLLEPLTTKLGRPVNPTVYSSKELAMRIKKGNAFVIRVLAQPKIWVIGEENALGT